MAATINDIAREAGVSTATVSRVLNNPEKVSERRKAEVERAIKKLHYAPNALARGLVTKNTNVFGFLIPDITNTFAPSIVDSFSKELEKYSYNIMVCLTDADPDKERSYINMMLRKRVEGIVLMGARQIGASSNDMIRGASRQIPIITLDYPIEGESLYTIHADEARGAYLAAEYLIRKGHTRIAFLNGDEAYTTYYYKKKGFEQAMRDYGIPVQNKYRITVEPHFSGGYDGALQLLQLNEKPTAIFAAGDQIAVGVYRAVHASKLKIPDDISVIGFSGSPISLGVYPALTTVAQYAQEMGEAAAHTLLHIVKGEPAERVVVFEPKILERESCAPIPEL
ncbi:LacI family DNA-binding transcriptional regulator [Christensenella intestinihominis]|uniref:LacI family DNA-binding transcriptional regulator n=1 Tax=Christensenella intestinihominis TaxID=1851429 RepID=UPI00082C8842|nr:LacI family DNA-binding transcriptional regulator [Christensenella intestinihominis]